MILKLTILTVLSLTARCDVMIFSEAIADNILTKSTSIFDIDESYLVFVSHQNIKTQELFEVYCENRTNCTILEVSGMLIRLLTSCLNNLQSL